MHRVNIVHPKDVTVLPPPAEFHFGASSHKELQKAAKSILPGVDFDHKEIIEMQQAAIRGLESDLEKTRVVAQTIANACLCLWKMLIDNGYTDDGESVRFSKELVDRMKGQQISIREDGFGDRFLRITNKFPDPQWEGGTDD